MLLGTRAPVTDYSAAGGSRAAADVHVVPVSMIDPDPENARKTFGAAELQELADSMKRHGQLQNVIATRDPRTQRYQLLAGNRRLKAAALAGIAELRVWVVPKHSAADTLRELSFAENMVRQDLSPMETARHMKRLMDLWGISGAELARRIGIAQSTVSKRLALLKLDESTAAAVDAGTLTQDEARQSTVRPSRAKRRAARGRRGVFVVGAGEARVKRGRTLRQLVDELLVLLADEEAADRSAAA